MTVHPIRPAQTVPTTLPSGLKARICDKSDAKTLRAMRRVCGWGVDDVDKYLASPDVVLYLFELDGKAPCMAGLFLELEDQDCASRRDGIVEISSLFIYPEARSRHYGAEIMDYLETVCVEEYRCRTIILKTRPFVDDQTRQRNSTLDWYLRRGYVEFKERKPLWQNPAEPDSPGLIACYLRRDVPQ